MALSNSFGFSRNNYFTGIQTSWYFKNIFIVIKDTEYYIYHLNHFYVHRSVVVFIVVQ